MTKTFDNVPPCSYGDGAPAFTGQFGARYIDTTANQEYYYDGAAWQVLGGGGTIGLQYSITGFATYIYGVSTVPAVYNSLGLYAAQSGGSYAGHVIIRSGYGTAPTHGYISLRTGNNSKPRIHMDGVSENIYIVGQTYTYIDLPAAAGPSGSIWQDPADGNKVKFVP